MDRRAFLQTLAAGALCGGSSYLRARDERLNIILIVADDLGYGDLGCYGSRIQTPNIDRLSTEGARFTDFYSGGPVCSPSRAALLTGRYSTRSGVTGVIQAADSGGLPGSETTIAQTLQAVGYNTACLGKWHLGRPVEYLPTNRGFNEYFGIPYSNDMYPLPLLRNTTVADPEPGLDSLLERFTSEAVSFIGRARNSPFFLYMPHSAPHIPLVPSQRFRGRSMLGPYGDMVEALDWSVGEVMGAVKDYGLDDNTLVIFTSDHGPWFQGSAGRLRGRKGETYEGGMRVPFLARLPGSIPAGQEVRGMATALDFFPTFARIGSATYYQRRLDGIDIWPLLVGEKDELARDPFLYFNGYDLQCARYGPWKVHFSRYLRTPWNPDPPGGCLNLPLASPELYDMRADAEEACDCSSDHPEVVAEIRARVEAMLPNLPDTVTKVWQDTMKRSVDYSPPGALPVRKSS